MTGEGGAAEHWQGRTPDEWRERWGVPLVRVYRRVGSTNDAARTLAEQGAPAGTVVLAEEQTRGRGRRGRAWTGTAGASLLMSTILRPAGEAGAALPLRLGLAAARAIEWCAPVRVGIKWPNDLILHGRKVGGVLAEAALEGGRPLFLIAGIGINVKQREQDWPPELAGVATSVESAAGVEVGLAQLAERLVAELVEASRHATGALTDLELEELGRRDTLRGREVAIDDARAGLAAGIAADGRLMLERDGARRGVVTGTVRALDQENGTA